MDDNRDLGLRAFFWPLYLPSFLFSLMEGMLLMVLPLYLLELGMGLSIIGLALAGRPAGMLAADVPVGMMIGRYGQKNTMLAGLALFGCANFGMFLATDFPVVFLLQLLVGISTGAYGVARLTSFVELSGPETRGRSIALMAGSNRFGYFIGPIVGGGLAAIAGLEATFLLSGVISMMIVLIVAISMKRAATEQAIPKPVTSYVGTIKMLLASHWRVLLPAGIGQMLAQLIRAARQVLVPLFGAKMVGLKVDQIGIVVGAAAAVDMSLFYCAGWLMDNWGRKAAIVPSFTIQACGVALLPFAGSFLTLLLAACLIGVGNGLGSGNMMTLGGDLAPSQSRGEFLGIWRLIGDAGHTGAPLLIGSVAEMMTLGAAAFSVSLLGLTSVALFLVAVPETYRIKGRKPEL